MENTLNSVKVENLSIATNLNTTFKAFDFSAENGLIAFASANLVCILKQNYYNNKHPKVLLTLKGHSDRVNSVQWLTPELLVSVSVDTSIILWKYTAPNSEIALDQVQWENTFEIVQ